MKITAISDTHNQHLRLKIPPEGDVIVHSGDCTGSGSYQEIEEFLKWYGNLDYELAILIPGNHDWGFERDLDFYQELCDKHGVVLLNDSGYEHEGVLFWGSPVQPEFFDWAFNRSIHTDPTNTHSKYPHIKPHWDKIPKIDKPLILITHSPPVNILDKTKEGNIVGCPFLPEAIERTKPILHIFGHIHEARGVVVDKTNSNPITYCNASSLDRYYKSRNINHFIFDLEKVKGGNSKGTD